MEIRLVEKEEFVNLLKARIRAFAAKRWSDASIEL